MVFASELNKLFVANGADGKLRIYDGDSLNLVNTVNIGEDSDNVRYNAAEKRSMSPTAETRRVLLLSWMAPVADA